MVASIQPVQIRTANLNKVGFGNEPENLTPEQPPVSLEPPKDEFVSEKKKSHAVRNGAIAGGVLATGYVVSTLSVSKGLTGLAMALTDTFGRDISKTKVGLILGAIFLATTAVGAGIGAIVKNFHKKEKAE
ncbi:MAG: hypothetical protein WCG23_05120 [bacterium]